MMTIGVDAHKRMPMAVALDDAGRVIDQWRGPHTPDGWREVAAWAQGVGNPRQWASRGPNTTLATSKSAMQNDYFASCLVLVARLTEPRYQLRCPGTEP